jgi:hypothetical protein
LPGDDDDDDDDDSSFVAAPATSPAAPATPPATCPLPVPSLALDALGGLPFPLYATAMGFVDDGRFDMAKMARIVAITPPRPTCQ